MTHKELYTHLKLNSYEVGLIQHALAAYNVNNAIMAGEESSRAIGYKERLLKTLEDRGRRLDKRWEDYYLANQDEFLKGPD